MAKKKREKTPDIAITVGRSIARKRKSLGKTQRKVAEEMETGVETISRLESGAILQTVDRLQQFSVVFDCPISSFFWDDDGDIEAQAAMVAEMLCTLPPARRASFARCMSELARALQQDG